MLKNVTMTYRIKKILQRKDHDNKTNEYKRSDYDNSFTITKNVLKLVTIRMTHTLTPFVSKCWDMFFWFEFVQISIAMVLEFASMLITARGGSFQDAVKIFRMMPCIGVVLLAIVKSYKMANYRPVFENLVSEVGDMFPEGRLDEEEGDIVDKSLKELSFVTKGYYWCNNALLISFLSPPFIESFKRALGYENKMLLHFFYWLPFDPIQPVYVDILLWIQTWHALVVIWCNLSGDLLFFTFMGHITTQFDLLALRIKRLVYVPVDKQLIDSYPLSVNNREFEEYHKSSSSNMLSNAELEKIHHEKIVQIIFRHGALIRLSGDVEKMFSFALLVNFFNSSIIICFCGFCCVIVEAWNETAYKSFLLTALSQTFLICWFGQKLLDSSAGISHAIYNSGWYLASKKIKSIMIIMMHRAQKEVRVTTYGFSVISLSSYTQIIKSSWSYFTLLLNTYKQ